MLFLLLMAVFVLAGKLRTDQDATAGFMVLGILELLSELALLSSLIG